MDVVVIAAGTDPPTAIPPDLASARHVVAADSGYDLAVALGLEADVLVGDLDSVSPEGLARARASGLRIVEHPEDKDVTDLELAIAMVVDDDCDRLVVIGGRGGRLDHQLSVVSILAAVRGPTCVEAWMGDSALFVVRDRWSARLARGATCSLLAWDGRPVVRTTGLRWPLDGEEVRRGSGRGVSNEALGGVVQVEVEGGVVLVIVDDGERVA